MSSREWQLIKSRDVVRLTCRHDLAVPAIYDPGNTGDVFPLLIPIQKPRPRFLGFSNKGVIESREQSFLFHNRDVRPSDRDGDERESSALGIRLRLYWRSRGI